MKKQLLYPNFAFNISYGFHLFKAFLLLFIITYSINLPASILEETKKIEKYLQTWQLSKASVLIENLLIQYPNDGLVLEIASKVFYHQGEYIKALDYAIQVESCCEDFVDETFHSVLKETVKVTEGFESIKSDHFDLYFKPGADKVLASYALETLEKAYTAMGNDFGLFPSYRIRVDIYPKVDYLAKVTTLTEQELKNSGTIAICKYNRLMITSPKGLATGYRWLDTLSHEYTHLIISSVSLNRAPIWLHEGIARYQEVRWRQETGRGLELSEKKLLYDAVLGKNLVTFDDMYPSMAKLPDQKTTSLAFAEVLMAIKLMVEKKGIISIKKILLSLAKGNDLNKSILTSLGISFNAFEREWMKYISKKPDKIVAGMEYHKLRFKKINIDRDGQIDTEHEEKLVKGKEIKKYLHLGNLMRKKGYNEAAKMEYEKADKAARKVSGDLGNPVINVRLAELLMLSEDSESMQKSEQLLHEAIEADPGYFSPYLQLGRFYLKAKQYQKAEELYKKAVSINPFHPEVHPALSVIYEHLGIEDKSELEKQNSVLLMKTLYE